MFESIKNENDEKKRTDYTGVIIGAMLLPMLLFFTYLGKDDMGLSVCTCLGMIMLAIRVRWELRKYLWFWITIVFILVLHVPLVLIFQWPSGWLSAKVVLPIGLADCLIIIGAIRLVEMCMGRLNHLMNRPDQKSEE
jgi:hypothetical protein